MMFGRVLWQLFRASRGRLAVALLALISGGTVCSALLNLDFDAESKLTREFRTLGANLVIAPPGEQENAGGGRFALLDDSIWEKVVRARSPEVVATAPYLYFVARASTPSGEESIVAAGTALDRIAGLVPWWKLEGAFPGGAGQCLAGRDVARTLGLAPGASLELHFENRSATCSVAAVITSGDAADNQVFLDLAAAQTLAGLSGRIGLIQMSVQGTPEQIEGFASRLKATLPGVEVRPVRQLAAAEGRLLSRIRGLVFFAVVMILTLTALCVLATMTALAMERRRDVGLMKALGGPMSRVVRLFLAEAGLLGLTGGIAGYAAGTLLSRWMGWKVFGVAVTARLDVLPLTLALMVSVSLAGAFPLRLLGRVRPAVILRGE